MAAALPKRRGERRAAERRRGGRPRSLRAPDVEWAIEQVWTRRRADVARDLGVDRRTLDRRLAERRAEDRLRLIYKRDAHELVFRCDACDRRTTHPVCPFCGHTINAVIAAERRAKPISFDPEDV